jgi:hypothetical protein
MNAGLPVRRAHALWVAAAAVHLALVICGAAKIELPETSLPGRAVAAYRAYSGSNNGFGFYAPAVASELRATYRICREGKCAAAPRPPAMNREAALLLTSVYGVRDVLAASLAAAQFQRAPDAGVIVVRAEAFFVPTMEEYRDGKRPEWRTGYEYAFTRARTGR